MKKLLLTGFLLLLIACQSATVEPSPTPEVVATRTLPTPVPVSSPQGATVTPTDIPIPIASPTPVLPERYFTEEFDAPLSHWSTLYASGDSSRVNILNENSVLTFELYSTITWLYVIYGAFEYEGVQVGTRVETQGSNMNAMGLICHYSEENGWYEFNVSSDGMYYVLYGQWLDENIARYTPLISDTSEHIQKGNATNEIGLDCYENILQLYINGKLLRKIDVAHIGLTGGKIGLSLASFDEAPVILAFDWVKVSGP